MSGTLLASLVRPSARHPHGGGLSFAVLRAAFTSARTFPPPRRSGLRLPTPVGHGRGLVTWPGCTGPGEGIDSAKRRLHRFRRGGSPRPSRFHLRLRSSMPGETTYSKVFCPFPGVNRPLHPSFTSFGRGSAMSAVYAFACHLTSIHNRRSDTFLTGGRSHTGKGVYLLFSS